MPDDVPEIEVLKPKRARERWHFCPYSFCTSPCDECWETVETPPLGDHAPE